MLIRIWDWLFTRKRWTVIKQIDVYYEACRELPRYRIYVMQDQFGNIKQKKVNF